MKILLALTGGALCAAPAAAQTDFRNLDRGRPTGIEDAYPIERFGFEVTGGYRISRIGTGRAQQLFEPELSFGAWSGLEVSVGGPIAVTDLIVGSKTGLAGLRLSAKANLTTELPWLPGIGVRLDGIIPVGADGGSGLGAFASILATRSFGPNRLHLNAGAGLGRPDAPANADALPQWRAGLGMDHTLLRSSTLLVIELVLEREWGGADVSVSPGIGFRRQLTPTLVVDGGVGLNQPSMTIGLSHAFGIARLMPGAGR